MHNRVLLSALVGAASVSARDVPSNVRSFYDSLKAKGSCSNQLSTGFYSQDDGPNTFSYCGDHLADYNVVYIKGAGSSFADMDVDCDGEQNGRGDDGRCESSQDTQSITSFQWIIEGYNKDINDLNANVHPYVVFGNEGTKAGWKTFNPEEYGIQPLSVIAVVCGDKLIYGVWGDENGDDGAKPMVGEASISLATACFGTSMNGNHGHTDDDVLYIAFPGAAAVPGADGADWGATSWEAFEASIEALGNELVSRIGGGGGGGGGADPVCEWEGHCEGAACATHDDCADPWGCVSGKCSLGGDGGGGGGGGTDPGTPTDPECGWEGHCEGAVCASDDDCADPWGCVSGTCGLDDGSAPNYDCEWEGHCEGAACTGDNLCGGELHCDATEKVCTMDGCAWAGHCLGAPCASHDECADPYVCNEGAGYCWYAPA